MAVKSKILIIGPTGATGRHIVRASVEAGHPTYILVSNTTGTEIPNKPELIATANPETKLELLESFKSSGVTLLIRFFPSEFGLDVDRHDAVEPVRQVFEDKARFRRQIEAAGIPYTYICCHAYTGYFLRNLAQVGCTKPPRDKVSILGDGNIKGAYVTQEDVGTYTIKAADDPRTLNKIVHIRLPANYLTMNEIVSMWENKIGKTLEKIYIPEEQILKNIKAASLHLSYVWALYHSQQIRGDAVYEIDPIKDFEAHELYPDVKYTTVDEYLDQFV
ncbi:hypothetical protein RIF29_16243 [Crotalaria pallida]|uniref:NmrA-like domain-containing protein n=1 Tax=Crotalaria pallida TaxID=3830 RepID=A0AAN9FG33_CROPI